VRSAAGPAQEYIIQAGSFSEFADADRGQARLALLGIESKVERAIVGNEIRYRVIIGPLSEREAIANTVRRLNAARIDSMPPQPVSN
jgi:cell division protein FtsN